MGMSTCHGCNGPPYVPAMLACCHLSILPPSKGQRSRNCHIAVVGLIADYQTRNSQHLPGNGITASAILLTTLTRTSWIPAGSQVAPSLLAALCMIRNAGGSQDVAIIAHDFSGKVWLLPDSHNLFRARCQGALFMTGVSPGVCLVLTESMNTQQSNYVFYCPQ